jgi:hypothetical protein
VEIIKQSKKTITVELSPIELELLRGAIVKENTNRRKAWKQVNPQFPEELMYHAIMNDTSGEMKIKIYKAIKKYQDWGILK